MLVALLIAESLLESLLHGAREQGLEPAHWDPSKALPFALNAAVVVIAAPIVEELTFRGLGFRLLVPFGTLVAVFGTALAFAADHGLVEGFPALFLFGLAVVVVRLRTGSLYPGMMLPRHLQCVRARGRRRPVARLFSDRAACSGLPGGDGARSRSARGTACRHGPGNVPRTARRRWR